MAAALTAFIFIINVSLSRPLIDALLFSLAIAVGIAPEMMPAIMTVSLSAGLPRGHLALLALALLARARRQRAVSGACGGTGPVARTALP